MALLLFVNHFLGGEGCQRLGVPVHHAEATIDVALVVEVDKHLDDTLRALLVHCEGCAVPVARSTQAAQLLQDDATMLVSPIPSVLQKLLAGEVVLLDALLGQFLHHLRLGCNRSVVGARHPAGVLALHASTTHEDILNRVVQHVTHVQHTRHVGRRNHNRVGLASIGFATEEFVVYPILIPFRLHNLWVVLCC